MQTASAERKPSTPEIRPPNPGLALAMASKFGKYKPEGEKAVRTVTVVEDETLKQLKAAWKTFTYTGKDRSDVTAYMDALQAIKPLKYSASDVERFSIALAEFQGEKHFEVKTGPFLTALINNGKETDYVVHTSYLSIRPRDLGFRNTKNITVNGNVGSGLGSSMKSGRITVNGNAGEVVGAEMKGGSITVNGDARWGVGIDMKGGHITVNGNAAGQVGDKMKGGSIIVKGNASYAVGRCMTGGEIHINGDIGDLGGITAGKIFHKDELIAYGTIWRRIWTAIKRAFE